MRGIRLQSCRRIVNLDAVGLVYLFFHHCRVTELKSHANHFFLCSNKDSYGMAVLSDDCRRTGNAVAALLPDNTAELANVVNTTGSCEHHPKGV